MNILDTIQIEKSKTIHEALVKLNALRNISSLVLFVTDESHKVMGSVTDGDIRRALEKEANLNKEIGLICNTNFSFIKHKKNSYLNLKQFKNKPVKILPVLDNNLQLVRIIDLDKTKAQLPLECMIMAGGRGKRLSPLTDTIPKPLLPLGGKPIIEHNIDRLINYGIQKIYISVKYLGEQIKKHFGDGSSKGISIEYIWEDEPLGTAGALSLVKEFKTDHILLMNSDLFTNIDFEEMYLKLIDEKADMAVASTEYKVDIPYAILEEENSHVKSLKEKPSYIYHSNAGVYILSKALIHNIPKNQFYDITDLMEQLLVDGKRLVHSPILGYWIDIGKPIDYKQAQEFIKHFNS